MLPLEVPDSSACGSQSWSAFFNWFISLLECVYLKWSGYRAVLPPQDIHSSPVLGGIEDANTQF